MIAVASVVMTALLIVVLFLQQREIRRLSARLAGPEHTERAAAALEQITEELYRDRVEEIEQLHNSVNRQLKEAGRLRSVAEEERHQARLDRAHTKRILEQTSREAGVL